MSIIKISESYIKKHYDKLETIKKEKLHNMESDLYVNRKYIYKVIERFLRKSKECNIKEIYKIIFPNAINIVDLLYDNNNFIGITNYYLEDFITLKKYMNNLDLYEIKEIMKEFISFYRFALSKKMLYWDIHLKNVGISNGKVYVCDIDSMDTKDYSCIDIKYTLNSILSLFYELYYKESIRSNYDNSLELISDISESPKYLFHDLTLKDVKDIIESSTIDYLEEKRLLLKKAKKIQKV